MRFLFDLQELGAVPQLEAAPVESETDERLPN